jgi:hypothetical protein
MKAMTYISHLAILGVFCVLATQEAQAKRTSLSHDLDPLRGPPWGQGGPWADRETYTPHAKPLGWIDPNPSRWPWTGSRDPYGDADSGDRISPSLFMMQKDYAWPAIGYLVPR